MHIKLASRDVIKARKVEYLKLVFTLDNVIVGVFER